MVQVKSSIHILVRLFCPSWVVIFEALFGCHDILILGKSRIKWQGPNITVAVDWDFKQQFKQANKIEASRCVVGSHLFVTIKSDVVLCDGRKTTLHTSPIVQINLILSF